MKYVVSWETRQTASEEMQARGLQVFSKWTPSEGTTFHQFLGRVDGRGGYAVVETDDPALVAKDMAVFSRVLRDVRGTGPGGRGHRDDQRRGSGVPGVDQLTSVWVRTWQATVAGPVAVAACAAGTAGSRTGRSR